MSLRLRLCLFAAALFLGAAGLRAQNILYVADGDSHSLQAIDTTTGSFVYSVSANSANRGYPIAVRNTIWLGDINDTGLAREYALATGTATGNTATLAGTSVNLQLLDGTAGTSFNYTLAWNNSSNVVVYKSNPDWSGLTQLFSTSSLGLTTDVAGIAYDFASGNLWLSSQTTIYQVTTAGAVVSSFMHSETSLRGSLAYQRSTDTLWYVPNDGSAAILQFDKTGTLLRSLTTPTRASNVWGAEFAAIPEPSTWALLALGGGLVLLGARRRR